MSQGLRLVFDQNMQQITDDVVAMGASVGEAIRLAMQALVEQKGKLAEKVVDGDALINQLRYKIEETCVHVIVTQQPAASDLRAVIASMHIAVEMERMGDYAAGIAKTVILMKEEPLLKTLRKIPLMGELSQAMLADCIQAYVQRDADTAQRVAAQDQEMDDLYRSVFNRLIKIMADKPDIVTRATYLMWCSHNLERIADRVTNIAERIIFMVTGSFNELNQD